MAVSFLEAVTFAAAGGDPQAINPATNPNAGDILILAQGISDTATATASTLTSDSFGGTWVAEYSQVWAARRRLQVWQNDSWTTASGSVSVDFNHNQEEALGLLVVSGADTCVEEATAGDGVGTSWTPSLTGHAGHVVVIQMESTGDITGPAEWTKVRQVTAPNGLRSLAVFTIVGQPPDLTPTFSWSGTNGFTGWAAYFTPTPVTGTAASTLGSFTSAASGTQPTTLAEAIMTQSPLGYWKLDETSGTTATDSSGHGRHGTYVGTLALASVAGPAGTGDYPDFQDDWVTIPDDAVFSVVTTPGLTWFAVINPTSVASAGHKFVITKANSPSAYEWGLSVNAVAGGKLRIDNYRSDGANVWADISDGTPVTTGWQAIAAYRSHTDGVSGSSALYRNSATPVASTVSAEPSNQASNTTSQVWIGARQDLGATLSFDGGIGHVAVFAGVMPASEVQVIMDRAAIWLAGGEGGGGITGTVAVTLAAFTAAASGTATPPPVTGTVAVTLGSFTAAGSGTVTAPTTGTVAVTLATFDAAASGTFTAPSTTGTAAVTLEAFVSSAAGTATPPPITGTAAVTLDVFVAAGSGIVTAAGERAGSVAVTLDPFTPASSGTSTPPAFTGTATPTLDTFLAVGAGTVTLPPITGTVAVTLGLFICTAFEAFRGPMFTGEPRTTSPAINARTTGVAGNTRTTSPAGNTRTTEA